MISCAEDGGAIQQALAKYIGRSTVPQVFINGEHIGGSDDTVAAHRNGRLVKLLKKSTTSQKEQSQESELWTGRGAADKVPAQKKEEPFFSYSRMWPPVLGAAIMMSMFLAWVAAKPLVVHRIRTRMSARPGRPPFKRQMSTPNVDKFQRVWLNGQFWALLPSTVKLNWQLEICEQEGSGKYSMQLKSKDEELTLFFPYLRSFESS